MRAVTPTEVLARNFGIEKAVELIAQAGFDGIDFSDCYDSSFVNEKGYIETAKKVRDIAENNGVSFCQSHAPFVRALLRNGDWDYAVERTRRSMEVASVLGSKITIVHPYQVGNYTTDSEILYEQNMKFFKALIPFCEEYDVKVAIENMVWSNSKGERCDGVCAVPQEFKRYIESLNSEYITGCLDFGHLTLCQREPQDVLRYLGGDLITSLHVHDNDYLKDRHTLPCTMNMDWDEICKALAEIKYKGDFTLECDSFLARFSKEFMPTALKFMCDISRYLIGKIEGYRA